MTEPGQQWDDNALADPHHQPDKASRVREMFTAIAPAYDLNNRLHSLGQDARWRRKAVQAAAVQPTDTAIDLACGTGQLTRQLARGGARHVIGLDFTPAMLPTPKKVSDTFSVGVGAAVDYVVGDAMCVPLPDGAANIVTMAFGLRNVADPAKTVRECYRLLQPGGRVVILEFSTPRFAPVRWLYHLYANVIMPRTATWISRDRTGAYRYLPRSVNTFLDTHALSELLTATGFTDVSARPLTFGIVTIHRAVRA